MPVRARLEAALASDSSDVTTRLSLLELGPPVGWPLKFRVTGPDYATVRAIAAKVAANVDAHPATRDVNLTAGEADAKFAGRFRPRWWARRHLRNLSVVIRLCHFVATGALVILLAIDRDRDLVGGQVVLGPQAPASSSFAVPGRSRRLTAGKDQTSAQGQEPPALFASALTHTIRMDDDPAERGQSFSSLRDLISVAAPARAGALSIFGH